jgi:hypothetical protein
MLHDSILYEVHRIVKFIDSGSRMIFIRSWGGEKNDSYYLIGTEFQLEKNILKVLEMNGGG